MTLVDSSEANPPSRRPATFSAPAQWAHLHARCGMLALAAPRFVMSIPVEDIAAQALSLPPEDRAKLIERLIASFEPRSASQVAWLQLARARRDEVKSGKVAMVHGDEALARVRARIR